ncbi:putative conserved lipoprotein LpqG [Actinoplanes cyaneus]|uniref:Conserved lipoprotein LpqG n=1 Tax=Actinoplanes cyaneus TaxID=52696 RepID=A0A919M5U4_9ACTN|nr:SIMPL domain-containing protein [Actinoplanes cyaneus]MCW2140270.1 hypothetical protein [Actinoplanes cyaneus]GID65588.1 putative conserved lipoprotein LpqG [Actinoplanes cyaneus]
MKKSHVAHAFVVLATLAGPSLLAGGRPAAAASAPVAGESAPAAGETRESVIVSGTGEETRESVIVSGTGKVSGEPDVLTVSFGVETDAPAVGPALDRAATASTRMRDALIRAGVAKADLQTSDVSVNSRRNGTKITGYTVSQGLTAKIRTLPKAGAVISAAMTAGGDAARLHGTSFAIENDGALLTEARKRAFADARGKAELYAREAGRPLGRVIRVSEESAGFSGGTGLRGLAYADQAAPVEPGRQDVSVTISVEWALNPPA